MTFLYPNQLIPRCVIKIFLAMYKAFLTRFNYGKCSKISNTLKLRTPKIIAENNFEKHPKKSNTALFRKNVFLKLKTHVIFGGKRLPMTVYLFVSHLC